MIKDIDNQEIKATSEKSDLAILVVSYDGYSDLWDDFFNLLNKYWADRDYPVYLANNVKRPRYHNVSVINSRKESQWSTRTRIAIGKIKEPYICLLHEDYFIGNRVDNEKVSEALGLMKRDGVKYYKLNNFSKVKTKHYKNIDYLQTIPENLEYGIGLQAAIWDRKYLLDLVGEGDYSAWKFEVDRIRESEMGKNKPLRGCIFDSRNILNICHGVVKGKYLPSAIKYFEKQNYYLNTSHRVIMTNKQYLICRTKRFGKTALPNKCRKLVKKILNALGMKFISLN